MISIFLTAPVSATVAARYGNRSVAFLGGWFASVGIAVCSFARSYIVIFSSIGILTGIQPLIH